MPLKRHRLTIDTDWKFKQEDGEDRGFLPVSRFPTNVHLDLLHHGLIPDPFMGKTEDELQWIGEKVWIYQTTFPSPELKRGKAVLVFHGLDTYATVTLNGQEILKTDNMFVPARVDVASLLTMKKENTLEIRFESAFLRGKRLASAHPEHVWGCWNGDPSRLAVRKAQYHYGWDWGPMLMTCGPWRPVTLETYDARIVDLHFRQDIDNDLSRATIIVKAEIEGPATHVLFELILGEILWASELVPVTAELSETRVTISKPELWYPSGYGKQPLYELKATAYSGAHEVDSSSKKIGLRSAKLIQRPLEDAPGKTFFFEINDIPIFCGGSDWIPADSFIPRISDEKYRNWVKLAVEGNQVMIRVWGGGIFEEEAFYDACDEFGILVWQDFLFGCGNYPAFPSFLDSVQQEAEANVKRLRHHPSIVIWAGNNEDYQYREEQKLEYDPSDLDPEHWLKTNFPARYIYEKILLGVTRSLVPDTYYHFGSPYGGQDTRDPTEGDIHQWNVWHGTQEKYQDWDKLGGRFVSEFGMEGFPNIRTIDGFLPKGKSDLDRYAQSSTMDFHNKAAGHERRLALYLIENLRLIFEPIEQYVYCTQLMQAECLSSAYRLWRRDWKGPGKEYCAGALVWQLNDCWPVTSWAIVDYHLRPKLAYYAIKREMAAYSVGVKRIKNGNPGSEGLKFEIWAGSRALSDAQIDLEIRFVSVQDGTDIQPVMQLKLLTLRENRTTELASFDTSILDQRASSTTELDIIVVARLLNAETGVQLARYVNWPDPLKHVHLRTPERLVVDVSDDLRTVELSTDRPIKGLALEIKADVSNEKADRVKWADNCIDLLPGESIKVGVSGLCNKDHVGVRYLGSV